MPLVPHFRMTLISKFKMSILQRWCTFWLEQWVFENLWQESHLILHNSQSVIYNASTKLNPHAHPHFDDLQLFRGCHWSHISGWNGRKWRLGSKYWFLIHRAPAQAPKMCFNQQEPHRTRDMFILFKFAKYLDSTPKEKLSQWLVRENWRLGTRKWWCNH